MEKKKAEKTRNGGTMTESQYWGKVRSLLRSGFRYWGPMALALKKAERKYVGENKRQKYEYKCQHCKDYFIKANVQVDHIIPCGSLKCSADLESFLERLTPESLDSFQVLCKPCHQIKTNSERKK
jgi:5-methylcytosine-specific restriction endonuclease McrA